MGAGRSQVHGRLRGRSVRVAQEQQIQRLLYLCVYCVCVWVLCMYIRMYVCIVYVCMYVCVYVLCMYVCVCSMYVCVYLL